MDLLLIVTSSGFVGLSTAFICLADAHHRVKVARKLAYEEGKADGFLEGVEKVKDMGYKLGRDKGYIEGLTKGRQEGHLALRSEMTLVRGKRA